MRNYMGILIIGAASALIAIEETTDTAPFDLSTAAFFLLGLGAGIWIGQELGFRSPQK